MAAMESFFLFLPAEAGQVLLRFLLLLLQETFMNLDPDHPNHPIHPNHTHLPNHPNHINHPNHPSLVPGDKRRVMTKNVAILADSLPLSASKHNTMFLKTGNTSCVSILVVFQNQTNASNITTKIKTEGDFE